MEGVVELRTLLVLQVVVSRSFERRAKGCTVGRQSNDSQKLSPTQVNEKKAYLLWDSSAKLPTYSGLNGQRDIVHLDFAGSPGVFGVHQRIGKDLRGVAMGELE